MTPGLNAGSRAHNYRWRPHLNGRVDVNEGIVAKGVPENFEGLVVSFTSEWKFYLSRDCSLIVADKYIAFLGAAISHKNAAL